MQVASIKKKDIPSFSKLAKNIILESPYYSDLAKRECLHDFQIKKIKTDLKDKNIVLLSAADGGKIAGFIRGFFESGISSGIFWLQWIGVDVAHRKSNVANEMLNYLTKRLKGSCGVHKIVCVIRPGNDASIKLFRKNKYRKLTLLKKHWYKEDFLLWYKNL